MQNISNSFTFATWNVNSIRSRAEQFNVIMKSENIDLIMLQETKAQNVDFPKFLFEELNYNVIYHGQKTYNGVAIASKYPLEIGETTLPLYEFEEEDKEARYIEASININGKFFIFINVYIPMGDSEELCAIEDKKRFKYKINFYKRLEKRLEELKKDNTNIIIGGDFNVAKDPIDLAFPQRNEGSVGFHPIERVQIKAIEKLNFCDIYRFKNPCKQEFTWWDYRTRAFDRNSGWRLDYLFCHNEITTAITDCSILVDARGMNKASDHTVVKATMLI